MQPVIGIFTEVNNEKYTRIHYQYAKAIEDCGGVPILFPYTEKEGTMDAFIGLCDGFLFTGGADVNPERYGEQKKETCGEVMYYRDQQDFAAVAKVIATDKPIFAICRGMQLVNVALGGTLYQDLFSENPTTVLHRDREQRYELSHEVKILDDTPLCALLKSSCMMVNSFHHQAIKTLGKGLEVMAIADDGIIEAVYAPQKRFFRAYQWHPERLSAVDKENQNIFEEFVAACKKA